MSKIDKIIFIFIIFIMINMSVSLFFKYLTVKDLKEHNIKMVELRKEYNTESIRVSEEFNKAIVDK